LPFNKILKEKSKLSHWIELIAEESSEHQILKIDENAEHSPNDDLKEKSPKSSILGSLNSHQKASTRKPSNDAQSTSN